jgi:tetratricopeptide (TPR) repeat protein
MGSICEDSDGRAKAARPFQPNLSQEDFDREFFGCVLQQGVSNTDVVRRQAELLARHGDYQGALQLDRLLIERHPSDPVAHYNLACSLSMNAQHAAAVNALARAIELGYRDFAHILADSDLDALRDLPSFRELVCRQEIPRQ